MPRCLIDSSRLRHADARRIGSGASARAVCEVPWYVTCLMLSLSQCEDIMNLALFALAIVS
jgi:hypothetical protein